MTEVAVTVSGVVQISIDPISREVVKGALSSMQGEMELLLERTAMAPFIREKKDYFIGIFDADGGLVMGTNIPVFGDLVRPLFKHFPRDEMRPGDIYWYSDCYGTGGAVSHTPDQVYVSPIFVDGEISAFVQSWAHFQDVGGMRPGSLSPDATDIFQEGIIIPPVRLYREGVLNEDAFRIFQRNSRFPEMIQGDTRAAVAAVRLGERRLLDIMHRFGAATVSATFASLIEETRQTVRARMKEAFPAGTYSFTEYVDEDGQGNGPFAVRFDLISDGDRFILDATRSDDQAPGPINYLTHPNVLNMIFGIYFISQDPDVLLNEGANSLFDEVRLRPGSILSPISPAPLGQRGVTLIRMISACCGLIGVATGGNSVAASNVYALYYMRGREDDNAAYLLTDGVGVGCGARPFADGIDAVYLVAQENYPAEFMDSTFPVRLLRYNLNRDSGGPGRWRGGCGVVRDVELLAPSGMLSNRAGGIDFPPWGIRGGQNGGDSRYIINPGQPDERTLPPMADGTILKKGDILRIQTGGGGGWGHPFDREPERVREDVRGGVVSLGSAERDYGVVLTGPDFEIDVAATARLRANRSDVPGLFHRREYVEAFS
jgi:N-methylhydantoinase B